VSSSSPSAVVKEKVSPFLCRRIGEDTKEIFRESNNNEFSMCKVIVYVDQL
jgi:hypothetical protein